MSFLGNFAKLVGNGVHNIEQAPQAIAQASENVGRVLGGQPTTGQQKAQQEAQAAQAAFRLPAQQLMRPVGTGFTQVQAMQRLGLPVMAPPQYTPAMGGAPQQNYMTSASHSPIPSFMGNRYAQNPASPEFQGVDPAIFGYPADNLAQQ